MSRSFSEGVRDAFDRASDMDRAMSLDTMGIHAKHPSFGEPLPPIPLQPHIFPGNPDSTGHYIPCM